MFPLNSMVLASSSRVVLFISRHVNVFEMRWKVLIGIVLAQSVEETFFRTDQKRFCRTLFHVLGHVRRAERGIRKGNNVGTRRGCLACQFEGVTCNISNVLNLESLIVVCHGHCIEDPFEVEYPLPKPIFMQYCSHANMQNPSVLIA
jgi:hypothetical protein